MQHGSRNEEKYRVRLRTNIGKQYPGYRRFLLAHAVGCFGRRSILKHHEWWSLDRNCKLYMKRLSAVTWLGQNCWYFDCGLIARQKRQWYHTFYSDKYLEFVHNGDCSLPLFTSVLCVQLSILKQQQKYIVVKHYLTVVPFNMAWKETH